MAKEIFLTKQKGGLVLDYRGVARDCRRDVIHPWQNNEQKFMFPLVSYIAVL